MRLNDIPNVPRFLVDIDEHVQSMPFGNLEITVKRGRSKTNQVAFAKSSTIAPKDNVEAFTDLEKLINSLILAHFDGKVRFALDFKKGTIRLVTIKNKEIKNYG